MRNTSLFKTSGEKGKMTVSIKLIDHHVEGQLVLNFKKLKVSFCLPYGERKRKATSLNKSSYMCKAKKKKGPLLGNPSICASRGPTKTSLPLSVLQKAAPKGHLKAPSSPEGASRHLPRPRARLTHLSPALQPPAGGTHPCPRWEARGAERGQSWTRLGRSRRVSRCRMVLG